MKWGAAVEYLGQDIKNGVQSVAQHMRGVALGWAGIVQHLDGVVQVLGSQLSHHGHHHIPCIVPACPPQHSQLRWSLFRLVKNSDTAGRFFGICKDVRIVVYEWSTGVNSSSAPYQNE